MAAVQHLDLGEMLRSVNDALLDEPYDTRGLALVEPTAGRTDGSVTEVDATGRPLGVAPDGEFRVGALALRPADALLLVSDTVMSVHGGST
jgi:hypothetical protein